MDHSSGHDAVRLAGPLRAGDAPTVAPWGSGLDGFTRSEARRLVFTRWLYRQDLLTEWPDLLLAPPRPARLGPAGTGPAVDATDHGGGAGRETRHTGTNG